MNPLLRAAETNGNVKKIQELLEDGADIHERNIYGQTALHLASRRCKPDVVRVLIGAGADIRAKDEDGLTPLHVAASYERSDAYTTAMLTNQQLSPNAKKNDKTPEKKSHIHFLRKQKFSAELVALRNLRYLPGKSPSCQATWSSFADTVNVLVSAGADIDAKDENGETALWKASLLHKRCNVDALLEAGADVRDTDKFGQTPLTAATKSYQVPLSTYSFLNVPEVLVKYILLQNSDVELKKPKLVDDDHRLSRLWEECAEELKEMKNIYFGFSNVDICKFFIENNINKLVNYMSSIDDVKTCKEWMNEMRLREQFPQYECMLTRKIMKVNTRKLLLYKYNIVVDHSDFRGLPTEIKCEISKNLRDDDLKRFVSSPFN